MVTVDTLTSPLMSIHSFSEGKLLSTAWTDVPYAGSQWTIGKCPANSTADWTRICTSCTALIPVAPGRTTSSLENQPRAQVGCPRKWHFGIPRNTEVISGSIPAKFRGIPRNFAEFRRNLAEITSEVKKFRGIPCWRNSVDTLSTGCWLPPSSSRRREVR